MSGHHPDSTKRSVWECSASATTSCKRLSPSVSLESSCQCKDSQTALPVAERFVGGSTCTIQLGRFIPVCIGKQGMFVGWLGSIDLFCYICCESRVLLLLLPWGQFRRFCSSFLHKVSAYIRPKSDNYCGCKYGALNVCLLSF